MTQVRAAALHSARHREVVTYQTRTRERVRDLAEVYTHEREVEAMLNLVSEMFPSPDRPRDIARTFLEPACGAGNFLVAVLHRKLAYVQYGRLYRSVATFEAAVLKALSSIYGIDIDAVNVEESRHFLRADVEHHMNLQLNTFPVNRRFWPSVDAILTTNIVQADTLKDAQKIRLVDYQWQRMTGYVIREWSYLEEPDTQFGLLGHAPDVPRRDEVAFHYSLLPDNPSPVRGEPHGGRAE